MRALSLALLMLLTAAVGCAPPNPDFCCVTSETCAAAGLVDELRPCDVGQACKSYGCVAAECTTSGDCTSPEAPTCFHGLCTAGCAVDDDCAGIAGRPRCDATDATCVGCTSNDQCPSDRAICDAETRACRGCTADDQCASGVCIEATGICAADSAIIYVTETGTDGGMCTKSAPCQTMSFALGLTSATRNVIRVLGSFFYLGNGTLNLHSGIVVDGNHTILSFGQIPAIIASGLGVLEGVSLNSNDPFVSLIKVIAGGSLVLVDASIADGQIEILAGGVLEATNISSRNSNIECKYGGTLSLRDSNLQNGFLDSACELVLSGNHLEPAPGGLPTTRLQGASQLVENNVFVGSDAEAF